MGNSKTKPEQTNTKEPTNSNNSTTSDPQLQIRNCVRNVRGNTGNFSEMYPNEAGASCGSANRSSVYTIDVHGSNAANFTNAGYVATEGLKTGQPNDGLPTYEEAVSGVKRPIYPTLPTAPPKIAQQTVEVVNEDAANGSSSRGRRNRHRRRHHHRHHNSDAHNENTEPDSAAPEEHRRHRHRRGFRLKRHLAKINRQNQTE